jgi:hypothetical protein
MRRVGRYPREWLTALWFAFLVLNASSILWLHYTDRLDAEFFRSGLFQLNAMYSPHVGATLAYYFGARALRRRSSGQVSAPFVLAVLTTLIWNGYVTSQIARLLLERGYFEDVIVQMRDVGGVLSWLVAPAMGFYFMASTGITTPDKVTAEEK